MLSEGEEGVKRLKVQHMSTVNVNVGINGIRQTVIVAGGGADSSGGVVGQMPCNSVNIPG